jgi:hypothetical protein
MRPNVPLAFSVSCTSGLQNSGSIQKLYLQNNQFSGPLPGNWASESAPILSSLAVSLFELYVSGNNLTGSVPAAWAYWNIDSVMYCLDLADNEGLCGPTPFGMMCFNHSGTHIGKRCLGGE